MMRREWNGKNYRFPLRLHIAKHREAFNQMVRAAQFIPYEVPNEHARVGRLIKSIQSKDPAIVYAMTHIQGNNQQRDDFELAADFLLLTAPKLKDTGSGPHRVSAIKTSKDGKYKSKSVGKTGVELRYYAKKEYKKLSQDQKKELMDWRAGQKSDSKSHYQKVAALEQQLQEMRDQTEVLRSTIASLTTVRVGNAGTSPLTNPLTQQN